MQEKRKKVYTAYTQNPFSPTTIYNKEKKRLYNNNTHGTEEEESENTPSLNMFYNNEDALCVCVQRKQKETTMTTFMF